MTTICFDRSYFDLIVYIKLVIPVGYTGDIRKSLYGCVRPLNVPIWHKLLDKESVMPKGPNGQKRPADAIGSAVMVAQIATGEIEDNRKSGRVKSGQAGAKARTQNLTSEQRSQIAKKAVSARWG